MFGNQEKFTAHNSVDVPPTGIINQETYKKNPLVKKIKSIPTKKFVFYPEQFIPPLKEEETRLITLYLKRHFASFLEIIRIKKEQQQNVKRYNVVFLMNDSDKKAPYNHVVLTKIVIKDGKIFFNTIEYGGMVLPNEMPSKKPGEELFFIHESSDRLTFLDKQIEKELDKFEKRKIEILLRRGRKAS